MTGAPDPAAAPPGPARAPLPLLIGALGAELDRLCQESGRLQTGLSAERMPADVALRLAQDLQALDRITQALADLARLAATLAEDLPAETLVPSGPLVHAFRLASLRERILGNRCPHIDGGGAGQDTGSDVCWL